DPPFDFLRALTRVDFSHVTRVSDAPHVLGQLLRAIHGQPTSAETAREAICPCRRRRRRRPRESPGSGMGLPWRLGRHRCVNPRDWLLERRMASCLSKTRMSIQLRVNSFARTITPLPPHEDCYVTDIAVSLQCRAFSMGPISIRPAFLIEREFSSERRCLCSPAVAREVCPQRVLQAAELSPSLGALALRPFRRLWGAPLLLAQLLLAQLLYHLPADFFESQFVSIQAE